MAKENVTERGRTAADLDISIHPRDCTIYLGTTSQLIAEGLIPDGFKWPNGTQYATVEVGEFEYSLTRKRPEASKVQRAYGQMVTFGFFGGV